MTRAEDFKSVVRRGRRGASRTVVVHLGPLGRLGSAYSGADDTQAMALSDRSPAVGFIVGKSVHRSSVVRHRVTRRLRHVMSERLGVVPAGSGVVVRALPRAAEAPFQELQRDVDRALSACLDGGGHRPRTPRGES